MVGGNIEDYFIKGVNDTTYLVKFLVIDRNDYCTVMAEIPKTAIDNNFIKPGLSIWWQNPNVLIKIEETQDVPFKKVGFSGGDKQSFIEDYKSRICV